MSTPRWQTTLRLVAGESPIPNVRLVWGEPVATFTVGSEGNWQVRAAGVTSHHLNFAFDGRQLFVATAVPGIVAHLGGAPIDQRWWPVQLPAEVRFGEAIIQATCEEYAISARPPPPAAKSTAPPANTVLEGAGAWDAAHGREGLPPTREAPAPSTVPKVHVPGPVEIRNAPPPINPSVQIKQPPPLESRAPVQANPPAAPLALPGGDQGMATTLRRPLESKAPAPGGARDFSERHVGIRPWPLEPGPAPGQAPIVSPPDAVLPATSFSPLPPVVPAPPTPPPHISPDYSYQESPIPPPPEEKGLAASWRSISPVKKAIAVLLPVALVVSIWPEAPAPPERSSGTKPTPSAVARLAANATAAGASAGARPPAASAVAVSPGRVVTEESDGGQVAGRPAPSTSGRPVAPSPPAVAAAESPAAPSGRVAEGMPSAASAASASPPPRTDGSLARTALDFAFEGRFANAIEVYEELARTRPDEPVFREAARILRQRNPGRR
jgi:hypothetical protein